MTAASHLPIPDMLSWYAIQTRYRFEKKVTTHLQQKRMETFLPLLREVHRWTDRSQTVETPLFSGYTFARINPISESRMDLLRTEGVIGLIEFAGQAVPIPNKQIEDLQLLLSRKLPCALYSFLKIGQRVRVRGGCLDGLQGTLDECGGKKLVITIDSIQRSVAVRIEGYELELI